MQARPLLALSPLLFTWLVAAPAWAVLPVQTDASGNRLEPVCGTNLAWEAKKERLGLESPLRMACPGEGSCDTPSVRDGTAATSKAVRLIVHVINDADGTPPNGVTQSTVDSQIADLNADYASHNISFSLVATRFHNDGDFYCMPNICSPQFGNKLAQLKSRYAETPDQAINIYVTCMNNCLYILFGSATFPWDPDALGTQGGIYMNAVAFGPGEKTLTHEMGHNLGLWHTQHGVDEVGGCSNGCRENFHSPTDPAADLVGDFCKDTPATPGNTTCNAPSGTDCNGVSWGATDPTNYMGYGPDNCVNHFSGEQALRMHCWTADQLSSQLDQPCTDPVPTDPSSLVATPVGSSTIDLGWTDNSNNEDGFRVERDGTEIATVGANVTSFSDTGLTCATTYSYDVFAFNCGGSSGAASAMATTGICPAADSVHVASIDMSLVSQGPWRRGRGVVTVVDQSAQPVSGATVDVDWSGTTSSSQSGVTGSSGQVTFTSGRTRGSSYCWTLTVTDISGSGLVYDAGANVETSDQVGNGCASSDFAEAVDALAPSVVRVQPNPSRGSTSIHFVVPQPAPTRLVIYDVRGREVQTLLDGVVQGDRSVEWNGRDAEGRSVSAGIYFYRLAAGDHRDVGRIVVLE